MNEKKYGLKLFGRQLKLGGSKQAQEIVGYLTQNFIVFQRGSLHLPPCVKRSCKNEESISK